jgi:hypothetical protein
MPTLASHFNPLCHSSRRVFFAVILVFCSAVTTLPATDETVGVSELAPNLLLFSTSSGNVIASVGPDGALLIGTTSIASTAQISELLETRTKSPVRYVVIGEPQHGQFDGDAGWGHRGAFVAMQEKGLERLGGHRMGEPPPLDQRFLQLGVDRPRVAFSEVLTFDMNNEAIHIIHQPPGYSDADILVHFHVANLVYMGNVFPGDSYPEIDSKVGAKLSGFVQLLGHWTNDRVRVVPAHGKVMSGTDVKSFHDMIVTVQGRIQHVIDTGGTEQDAITAQPTREFDATWGHGPVNANAFIQAVYKELKTP